jgi:hypothetical protein
MMSAQIGDGKEISNDRRAQIYQEYIASFQEEMNAHRILVLYYKIIDK